jgi:ubiquinol-cytochrome c reductase cytochrome b subunit
VLPYGQMSLWGNLICPKWFKFFDVESNGLIYCSTLAAQQQPFISPKTKSKNRIGPHNYDILCILMGSLLGDAFAEQHGNGTRICFQQEYLNSHYLMWFHNYLSKFGYCNETTPKITTRLGKEGKLRYVSRFKTYTFTSFNWIHTAFYTENKKIVPCKIEEFLSPLALSVWIMDDGVRSRVSSGLKLATNNFSLKEVEILANILRKKYNLKTSIIKTGVLNQYNIYIPKSSMIKLVEIIRPYLHTSMYYKLNGYI